MPTDLIVVGGGAAGIFAALSAAETNPKIQVTVLERGARPLAKVLISGGGRCNVTHACFDPAALTTFYPRGAKELLGPFNRFQPADTVAWFENRGVPLKTESDGRIFPVSDRAQTIVDCLLAEAARLRVRIRENCPVQHVAYAGTGFEVSGPGFDRLSAPLVVLAPGGNARSIYDSAAKLGHSVHAPVPSLFTFNIKDTRLTDLAGISVTPCELALEFPGDSFHASGPALITHWGLSGPAVLKLSAWAARRLAESGYRAQLKVNWLPGTTLEHAYERLLERKHAHPRASLLKQDPFRRIPARLWRRLCTHAGAAENRPLAETSNAVLRSLAEGLTGSRFTIRGKGVFKEEFVTCGGIALSEVNFRTMESRVQPGLFFAGEVLDIDGLTGGFNFQSAWTTGYLAGLGVAERAD